MTTTPPARHTGDLGALRALAHRSHEVITGHQHLSGAYPAAPGFPAYAGYAWLRDGSFTAEGISRYGDRGSASRFHDWTAAVLAARREQVAAVVAAAAAGEELPADQMLPARFTLAGGDGEGEWWDFQTDGYGTWLWAVTTHATRHRLDLERWRAGIELAVDYLVASWDRRCYDWWEEHLEQRHVSTLAALYGGLRAVAGTGLLAPGRAAAAEDAAARIRSLVCREGIHDGHLTKWLGATAVDGSLAACVVPFGLFRTGTPVATATLAAVARDLDVDGGVHRYRADVFYGGGQWPLLSALLGWNRAVAGDTAAAWGYLRWIAAQAGPDGTLPEQVDHHLLAPAHRAEWLARWGPVATPLLWSHGMYLILADELGLLGQGDPA